MSCLSEREDRIANLVADGLSNREIAARLDVHQRLIDATILRIAEKLRIHRRADFAARFSQHQQKADHMWLSD